MQRETRSRFLGEAGKSQLLAALKCVFREGVGQ